MRPAAAGAARSLSYTATIAHPPTTADPAAAAERDPGSRAPGPSSILFVGGTGRSGTHVVARLLGRHSHYVNVSNEVRFHAARDGFPDLLGGRTDLTRFMRRLRRHWWRDFELVRRSFRGLHRHVERDQFDAACERFAERFEAEPHAACRALFLELLWPVAERAGTPGLIEQSCDTIAAMPTLLELFGESRFLHCVRDGRDAAASRASQGGRLVYPRSIEQGLEWWEDRLRLMNAGVRAASVPPSRLMVISLDELVSQRRLKTLRRMLRFCELEPEPKLSAFHNRRIDIEAGNLGRWRRGMSKRRQARIDRRYDEALDRIERDRLHGWRALRRVREAPG